MGSEMCIRDRFYIRYTEYKKRVAHANAGGAIQREVVSIAELIPSHVQNVLLACTMNRTQVLLRSLKLRLRAMQGMVRAQRWSYLQRPRQWREFHQCFGAGGAVSSRAGRASLARNQQVPRGSGGAIGVDS